MLMKKKQLLVATLIIALGSAVAVNWYFTENPIDTREPSTVTSTARLGDSLSVGSNQVENATTQNSRETMAQGDFFLSERLKREETYDELIDSLEEMAEKETLDENEKEKIVSMLGMYSKNMKTQSDTESLITAKTASDCIVVINGESCQVIMEKNTLNDTVILQITEIIEKNTNISAKNLTIIEAK